jgi:hypothetical protein
MAALLTQAKAISELRERTGLSEQTATDKVKSIVRFAGVADGARIKVPRYQLELVIADIEKPKPITKTNGIRPLSPKMVAKIRAFGRPIRQKA